MKLPDSYSHTLGCVIVERELVTIWSEDDKGEWYSIQFVASRAK